MWILLEGLDRTGKSTVAEKFKKDGYEIVHMSAPDKKYQDKYYTGPSYLDELMDMLMEYDGRNVIFDRTWYGEFVWPHVYGRKPCLTVEELDIIQDYEKRNDVQKYLMVDDDKAAHWQRCVEDNEPLKKNEFDTASHLYGRMAHAHGFFPRSLLEFDEKLAGNKGEDNSDVQQEPVVEEGQAEPVADAPRADVENKAEPVLQKTETPSQIQEKLEKANAINSILSKRIVKSKGHIFDQIESDIKSYLSVKLSELMGTDEPDPTSFSEFEVQMLKTLCKQWEQKAKLKEQK